MDSSNIFFSAVFKPDYIFNTNDFFIGWKNKPDHTKFVNAIKNQDYKILAIEKSQQRIVGFSYAISDCYLSAYIPLLEVIPDYQGKGIGTKLIKYLVDQLKGTYMIDLCCDEDLIPFYESLNFQKSYAMLKRNYAAIV